MKIRLVVGEKVQMVGYPVYRAEVTQIGDKCQVHDNCTHVGVSWHTGENQDKVCSTYLERDESDLRAKLGNLLGEHKAGKCNAREAIDQLQAIAAEWYGE